MAGHLTVVAHIRAKAGKENEVKEALLGLVAPTRAEEGCVNYDLHQSTEDPTRFVFYENWTGKDALDKHLASPHVQAVLARAEELLAAPPEIGLYRMLSATAGRARSA